MSAEIEEPAVEPECYAIDDAGTVYVVDHEEERKYFLTFNKFLNDNYVLLGYHVTEPTHVIGEMDPDVVSAMNVLAEAIIKRMTRIASNDLPSGRKAVAFGA